MSVLINESHANPSTSLWDTNGSGKFFVSASTTQVIPIAGLTTNGLVQLTYVHPNTGGAGQFFQSLTYAAGQLTITLGQVGASPEYIVWNVLNF